MVAAAGGRSCSGTAPQDGDDDRDGVADEAPDPHARQVGAAVSGFDGGRDPVGSRLLASGVEHRMGSIEVVVGVVVEVVGFPVHVSIVPNPLSCDPLIHEKWD